MNADEVPLKLQSFHVVGDGQQVRFGRQVIGWMTPIAAAEQAQLRLSTSAFTRSWIALK